MNYVEQFESLAEAEYQYNPRLVDGLRASIRRRHATHALGTDVLKWVAEERVEETADVPHTGRIERHLHLVGSEEAGSQFIDYGNGDDAA